MGALAEFAGKLKVLAERTETEFASGCIREMAPVALAALKKETPKRSGRLADSETVDAITGGGTQATAILAPHTIYAAFRETGGTISVRNARVLTDGESFFGKHVTQAGSHYIEKGEAAGRGPCAEAAAAFAAEFFTL